MKCLHPFRIILPKKLNGKWKDYPDGLEVPCGKCIQCKIQKRNEWAMRIMHESCFHEHSCFITLTYEDKYLPENGSIKKSHLQKFMKRLRRLVEPMKLRYFACGEYGSKSHRPHYHLILFGLNPVQKKYIEQSWKDGFTSVSLLTEARSMYVAKYIDKKLYGELEDETYIMLGKEAPFQLCSKGLGKQWAVENVRHIVDNKCIYIHGVKHSVPRYYLNILNVEIDNSEAIEEQSKEVVNKFLHIKNLTVDDAYKSLTPNENIILNEGIKRHRIQQEKNIKAILALNNTETL